MPKVLHFLALIQNKGRAFYPRSELALRCHRITKSDYMAFWSKHIHNPILSPATLQHEAAPTEGVLDALGRGNQEACVQKLYDEVS